MRLLTDVRTGNNGVTPSDWFEDRFSALTENVAKVVVASPRTIHFALLGLFAQGHLLVSWFWCATSDFESLTNWF